VVCRTLELFPGSVYHIPYSVQKEDDPVGILMELWRWIYIIFFGPGRRRSCRHFDEVM